MKREHLEHIIRAASAITNQTDIIVIGSQAVLGQFPNAKAELLTSIEADVYPRYRPDMAINIDGAIGERSYFHDTFGYYAHGVDETTAILPVEWEQRLVPVRNENTGGGTGWCLEVHDLASSKIAAGREKDIEFVSTLITEKMVTIEILVSRIDTLPIPPETKSQVQSRLKRVISCPNQY